ncbi:MAG: methyl-accepting chemotaxis protein [Bryobacteraceae bacterium]|nr:methyl-accepting chemotaxis protein [Bryobacteraceae bacterium]
MNLRRVHRDLSAAVEEGNRIAHAASEMRGGLTELGAHVSSVQFTYTITYLAKVNPKTEAAVGDCAGCHSYSGAVAELKAFDEKAQKVRSHAQELRGLAAPSVAVHLDAVNAGIARWRNLYADYLKVAEQRHFDTAHGLLMNEMAPLVGALGKTVDHAETKVEEHRQAVLAEAERHAAGSQRATVVVLVFAAVVVACIFLILRSTAATLQRLCCNLGAQSQAVAVQAEQVCGGSQSISRSVSEQAQALEATASSAAEVTASAQQNANSAASVAETLDRLGAAVVQTNTDLDRSVSVMKEIGRSASKIGTIIKVIDGIAVQTNLLALNAAVEAARAGEAGLGFAVVADEVRSLAGRAAEAARDTHHLIEEARTLSLQGGEALEGLSSGFAQLMAEIEAAGVNTREVDAASREQVETVEMMHNELRRIESLGRRSQSESEESSASGENLRQQAQLLSESVATLVALAGGRKRLC